MKRFLILLFAFFLGTACSTKDDDLATERTAIEGYLAKEKMNYRTQNGVYIHVANEDREDRDKQPLVERGDEVVFDFVLYTFSNTIGKLIYTNVDYVLIDEETGESKYPNLNTAYWNFDPETVVIGSTTLVKGLEAGLIGCREGDQALIFLTSDLAYGDRSVSVIPAETPLLWNVYIRKVNKN